jgi:hypothetical protein
MLINAVQCDNHYDNGHGMALRPCGHLIMLQQHPLVGQHEAVGADQLSSDIISDPALRALASQSDIKAS